MPCDGLECLSGYEAGLASRPNPAKGSALQIAAWLASAAVCLAGYPAWSQSIPPTPEAAERGTTTAPPTLRPYAPGTPQLGTGGTPERPSTAVLRQDEDWSWLADVPDGERKALDVLKYIPLSEDGSVFATFALDGRVAIETYEDESFGENPGRDNSFHSRLNPHLGVTFGDRFRLYGALKFGDVEDRRFMVSPVDDDGPDVHQAFAELSFGDLLGLPTKDAFVRVGRQELHYGAGRQVSIRNGPNLRFDYDGVLARARIGPTVGDVFAVRPTENDVGAFDNGTDESQAVWGLYTSTELGKLMPDAGGLIGRSNIDLFYFGFEREESPYAFQMAPLDETRHTVGARLWTGGPPTRGWSLDLEAGYQFGSVEGLLGPGGSREADISAAFAAGIVSYGFGDLAWTPVLGLRAGITTGDGDPGDGTLTTYRGPFPPGRYFGDSNPIGPGNLVGFAPYVTLSPAEGLTLTGRYQAFWRVEVEDGLYSPPQVPLRMATGGERFVGDEISLLADWSINDYLMLSGTLSHFTTGPMLADNPPENDITYVDLKLAVQF